MDTLTAYRTAAAAWHLAFAAWRNAPRRSHAAATARAAERQAWQAMKQAGHAVTVEYGIDVFLQVAGERPDLAQAA